MRTLCPLRPSSRQFLALALLLAGFSSAATIHGVVIEDQDGSAVRTADVRLRRDGDRLLAANPDTDRDGKFEATDIPDGNYTAEVAKLNHIGANARFVVRGDTNITIRLIRTATISGRVQDANGRMITGSVIAMTAGDGPLTRTSSGQRTAGIDAEGKYRINNLPPGRYQLALSYAFSGGSYRAGETRPNSGVLYFPDNSRPQTVSVSGGEERNNLDFIVSTPAFYTVSGKIELPDPKSSFMMALVSVDQPALATATVYSLPDGMFSFKGVPAGSYTLFATTGRLVSPSVLGISAGEDGRFARTHVDVVGQNVEGLSLASQPGAPLTFALQSPPGCPNSAQITLEQIDDWGVSMRRQVALKATEPTMLNGVPPIRFSLAVDAPGCFSATDRIVDASANSSFTIVLTPAGSIEGKVTDGAAAVLLMAADGAIRTAFTDAESKFSFTGLRPGTYRIAARQVGSGPESRLLQNLDQMLEVHVTGGAAQSVSLNTK